MVNTILYKKKFISVLLAVILMIGSFSGIIPGMSITAQAAENYKVLIWSDCPGIERFTTALKNDLSSIDGANVTIVEKTGTGDLTAQDMDGVQLVYVVSVRSQSSVSDDYSLLGTNKNNAILLKDFAEAGGRVVMNGEHSGFKRSNKALSELAKEIGGQFTIDESSSSSKEIKVNPNEKTVLTAGCDKLEPGYYAPIISTNPTAVWLMKDSADKVFAVDQNAKQGHITALADIDWITTTDPDSRAAAKQFVENLLKDSAGHMEEIKIPKILIQPQDLTWYYGDNTPEILSITAITQNDGTLSYQWHKGNSADFVPDGTNIITGATNDTYSIPNPETEPVGKYYYKCVVTNTKNGESESLASNSAIATVLEVKAPVITVQPNNLTWYYGDTTPQTLTITATSPSGLPLTYQWYKGNTADFTPDNTNMITGATSDSYPIPSPETEPVGQYYYKCIVTNTDNNRTSSVTSDAAIVTVLEVIIPAKVIIPPTPKHLIYNGTYQELAFPGTASDGTMQYALGTASFPTESWSESIPKGISIGTYYIWYRAKGNDGNPDSESGVVVATIVQDFNPGDMETDVVEHENTPNTTVQGLTEDLAWSIATPEEQTEIVTGGVKGRMWLEITNIESTVDAGDKQIIESRAKTLNDAKVGVYLDLSMYFQVGNGNKRQLNNFNGRGIKVTLDIPAYLRLSGNQRTFYLVSAHDGTSKIHGSTMGDKLNATLTDFSTYAIIYADGEKEEIYKVSVKIKQTDDKIEVEWDKVDAVAKVDVYIAYCGTNYPKKPSMTTTKRKVTVKKINGKKLNQKRNYKMYFIAYDKKGNRLYKTVTFHFGGKNCKYTNPKSLKLSSNKVTLSVGDSTKVIGKITYENKKKKPLSVKHAARFRYVSDNPTVATVDKNGYITGVSPGKTNVFVICQNGLSKKVSVTVN